MAAPPKEIVITVGRADSIDSDRHGNTYPIRQHLQTCQASMPDIGPVPYRVPLQTTRHDNSIMSIGWDPAERAEGNVPENIVDGLENEDLWLSLRRFNKHIFHIKATNKPLLPGQLDFDTSPNEDFTSNKLRAQLERLYMGFVIGMLSLNQHISRLRSWREPRRTGLFSLVYFTSWHFALLLPTTFALMASLALSPSLRRTMFPPAPLAMVNPITGAVKPPPAGTLGTADSATGAPEAHKGETLENEASNFAASIIGTAMNVLNDVVEAQHGIADGDEASVLRHHYFHSDEAALRAAHATSANGPDGMKGSSVARSGKPCGSSGDNHDGGSGEGMESNTDKRIAKPSMLEPHRLATKVAIAKDKAAGVDRPSKDKSKVPIQKMVWRATRLLAHGLSELSDFWERCHNLISPNAPFPRDRGRARLAGIFITLFALTLFVSARTICRSFAFFVGVLIFGEPLLVIMRQQLAANDITLKNTIFLGIPTDAQQTITILRLGEAARGPIPPPPPNHFVDTPQGTRRHSGFNGVEQPTCLHDPANLYASFGDDPLGTSRTELQDMARTSHERLRQNSANDRVLADKHTHGRFLGRLFRGLKVGAKGVAKTAVAADAARAKVLGHQSARLRLGCADEDIDKHDEDTSGDGRALLGPVEFRARFEGEKGFVYLTTDPGGMASLCFTKKRVRTEYEGADEVVSDSDSDEGSSLGSGPGTNWTKTVGTLHPAWSLPVEEIAELNKFSGYGEKAKILAGWALGTAVKDGIQIVDRDGNIKLITAMSKRNELFNRLCAMGQQRWEVW